MSNIIFETDLMRYELLHNGEISGIYDKRSGQNYIDPASPVYFAEIYHERAFIERTIHGNPAKKYTYIAGPLEPTGAAAEHPESLAQEDNVLHVVFPSGVVDFRVTCMADYLIFELIGKLPENIYSMTVSRALLKPFGDEDNDFCVTVHSMNINTKPHFYCSPLEHAVGVELFTAIDATEAKFALIAATKAALTDRIRGLVPYLDPERMIVSSKGGAFAAEHEGSNLSYTIILDIDDLQKELSLYNRYHINQIDFHQSGAFRQGDMRFFDKYHNDPAEFRKLVAEPLKAAGKVVSLHTYAQMIAVADTNTLSDPEAQKDLKVIESFTLADDISETSDHLKLTEDISHVQTSGLFRNYHSPYLLAEQEIMRFEVGADGFCVERGLFGTKASAHPAGTKVHHLEQMFNQLSPVPGSELFFRIARYTAQACNEGGFGMIYFDALDSLGLLSPEYAWHYAAAFILEVLRHCDEVPYMEYSIMFPLLWHARSRMGAWDMPHRGYKYFVDCHRDFNQSGVHTYALPQMLGWFNFYPCTGSEQYPGKENRILHHDDVDLIGSRALAWNNSMASSYHSMDIFPKLVRNMERFAEYEHLRITNYFDESILAQMRNDGEYALEKTDDMSFRIRRMHYTKSKLCPAYNQLSVSASNPFAPQKPFLRLEGLYSIGDRAVSLTGKVDGDGTRLEKPVDLSATPCIRIKVTGNGTSDRLLVSLRSERHFADTIANYVIPCNFEGQKDFIFAENCNGDFRDSDFEGKEPCFFSEYMKLTDYEMMQEIRLYRQGNCKGVSVDEITMFDCQDIPVMNPCVRIGNQTLQFECTLHASDYIEYQEGKAILYDIYGNGREVSVNGNLPEVSGAFEAELTADNAEPYRAEITFGFKGDVLK